MQWKRFRLELGRTQEFPTGSASRGYLLQLPVDGDGAVDEECLEMAPGSARIRRHWPNEPETSGQVVRTPNGWAFSYRSAQENAQIIFHLESGVMCVGDDIMLTEPDGQRLPYRIVSID